MADVIRVYLRHIPINTGGYDASGCYWGTGQRLYRYAAADDSMEGHIRAYDRADAKEIVRAKCPKAVFYR